ncbi:MAG: methyltransferase [Bacilli bacterium]|nr:methyltransferase [Bacilli bacterium]
MKVINDLYDYEGFKIVQDQESFKFSLDSILLAEYIILKDSKLKVLDLCTGNAAIPLILSYYYSNEIVGFEIQKSSFDLALESIKINGKEQQVRIINDDVRNLKNYYSAQSFEVVLANPPYFKLNKQSLINQNDCKALARHEISLCLEDLFKISKYILKEKGELYLVHLPDRLEEILFFCEKYKIRAKKIHFIFSKGKAKAQMVLIKCVKGGNNKLDVHSIEAINLYKSYKNLFRM